MIESISFKKPFILRPRVDVRMTDGRAFWIKVRGGLVEVSPGPEEKERDTLHWVYQAAWEFLAWQNPGPLDDGAKRACAHLVGAIDWTRIGIEGTEARLRYLVDCFAGHKDIGV